jgi:hypothetical protein
VEGVEWFRGKGNRGTRQVQRGCCPRYQKGSEWGSAVPKIFRRQAVRWTRKIQREEDPRNHRGSERRGSAGPKIFRGVVVPGTRKIQRRWGEITKKFQIKGVFWCQNG